MPDQRLRYFLSGSFCTKSKRAVSIPDGQKARGEDCVNNFQIAQNMHCKTKRGIHFFFRIRIQSEKSLASKGAASEVGRGKRKQTMAGNGDSAARADEKLNCYVLAWEVGVVFTPSHFPQVVWFLWRGRGQQRKKPPPRIFSFMFREGNVISASASVHVSRLRRT